MLGVVKFVCKKKIVVCGNTVGSLLNRVASCFKSKSAIWVANLNMSVIVAMAKEGEIRTSC